jgi:polar amino acid transport system substrate-binding protein
MWGKACIAVVLCTLLGISAADARSLQAIRERGEISLCAHPNALPYSNRRGNPPGFQGELGRALAAQLGVEFAEEWVIGASHIQRVGCDFVLDAIATPGAQEEDRLKLSQPYRHTGVALVVPPASKIRSFQDLANGRSKVGVPIGSLAAMIFDQRDIPISVFGFEDDILEALANHEIDVAAVSAAAAGYFNMKHPGEVRVISIDNAVPELAWNVAVGLVRPDLALIHAIDEAMARLRSDGTIARIYARYGVTVEPPK